MSRDGDRQRLFTRRALLMACGQSALLSVLGGRLYYLQIVEADHYATLADDNRINLRLLPPPRGRINDRRGRPLAVNRQNYRAVLIAEQIGNVEDVLDVLGRVIAVSEADRQRILNEVRRKRKFVPVTAREDLAWDEVARIAVNAPDLPGVAVEEGQSRVYPHGPDFAHVLGYVAAVSEGELTGDPLLELPGFRTGKSGIEQSCDLILRGKAGRSQVEVNAIGRVIRELKHEDGEPGADINLSLDLDLQRLSGERLGDESGAVVLLDVLSGEVLALASNPAFDPNAFNRGLSVGAWRALISDPKAPLTNKAISGLYAPGSTFKPVTALAALRDGDITPETKVTCYGRTRLGDATFHCWKRGGHGVMNLQSAIAESCDVYFYEAARRCGIDKIAAMASRLGLGAPTGIELAAERGGVVPSRDWKLANLGVPWQKGETLIAGIGQGFVLTTPLQLAVMTARIAGGGDRIVPRLIDVVAARQEVPTEVRSLGLDPQHLELVRDGMAGVMTGPRGTARHAAIREPGMKMAGKTGTAQVRRITRAERDAGVIRNEDLPWRRRDHALFIGFAPVQAPRYAVAVVVEHGGSGSAAAAPIASDILYAAQTLRLETAPTGQAAAHPAHAAGRRGVGQG
ncbi:MAG: penicillin-binding protein 2 [Rhodospirillales bacterium]|nr:penicillin-binding protein 2 [Rhodospirillales bacterium]